MLRKSIAGAIVAVAVLASMPAKAEEFESALQQLLTPEEVAIHQERGNAKALELAHRACQSMNAGTSIRDFVTQVSRAIAQEGLQGKKLETTTLYTGKVIAVGVLSFCPDHLSELQELSP